LIRVSTISANESQSYRTEEQFVRDMLGAVPKQDRKILMGQVSVALEADALTNSMPTAFRRGVVAMTAANAVALAMVIISYICTHG